MWIPQDFTDVKSIYFIKVKAWCRQATSHYLKQCWLNPMLPCGITKCQLVYCCRWYCEQISWPLFTKRTGGLLRDIVNSRSRGMPVYTFPIALKFDWQLRSSASKMSDKIITTSNPAASRLHEILWQDALWIEAQNPAGMMTFICNKLQTNNWAYMYATLDPLYLYSKLLKHRNNYCHNKIILYHELKKI